MHRTNVKKKYVSRLGLFPDPQRGESVGVLYVMMVKPWQWYRFLSQYLFVSLLALFCQGSVVKSLSSLHFCHKDEWAKSQNLQRNNAFLLPEHWKEIVLMSVMLQIFNSFKSQWFLYVLSGLAFEHATFCIYVVCFSEQTALISLHGINL